MRRTNSQTFDSTGNIVSIPPQPTDLQKNRVLILNIRRMTLTSIKKGSERYQQPTRQLPQPLQNSIFKRATKNLKRSIVPSRKRDCEICESTLSPDQLVSICDCPHLFCEPCANSYLTYKINAFEDVVCPKQNCLKAVNQKSELFHGLAIQLKKKFKKHENFVLTQKDPTKKPCQKPNCEGIVEIVEKTAICNQCRTVYCHMCMYEKHEGECSNFQVEFLQNNYKFRQCSKCKNVIEKNQGCNHITCRCGHQFCYICGADWDKDPCRGLGPPVPPPPPQPRQCCSQCFVWTLKIFLIPLWAVLGLLVALIPFLLFTLMIVLISLFGGPCEFMVNQMESDNACCMVLLVLCTPFLYLAGIPVFLASQCGEICESLSDCFGFYWEVLRSLANW